MIRLTGLYLLALLLFRQACRSWPPHVAVAIAVGLALLLLLGAALILNKPSSKGRA
ncbi:hypothetical protein MF271_05095 [Deinococcus sp. KNUC1210]|uniref:hypothetical protein n=1 Tax=Deinococcus sp. KNUC1210 TaxID=2917691 RepID=UPI001EF0747E|nr:hypothetical protein [Deinococcus sp. KNUC1210]ULH16012.1 hypothetical protein MF271_05095 [Deinococcus sp. KNUC1210]